jgi:TonB family protein
MRTLIVAVVLACLGSAATSFSQSTPFNDNGTAQAAPEKASHPSPDADGAYVVGGGVTIPKVIHSEDPQFTNDARRKRVAGTSILSFIVDIDGNPTDVHVKRSLAETVSPKFHKIAEGLDQQAIKAVSQYKFEPATLEGKPVPVKLTIEVSFRLY